MYLLCVLAYVLLGAITMLLVDSVQERVGWGEGEGRMDGGRERERERGSVWVRDSNVWHIEQGIWKHIEHTHIS